MRQTGGETATITTRSEKKIGETGWRREDEDGEKVVIGYDAGGERTRTRWGLETGARRKKNHCYIIIVILCINYFLKLSSLKRSNDWYVHAIDGHLGTNPVEYVLDTCTYMINVCTSSRVNMVLARLNLFTWLKTRMDGQKITTRCD